MLIVNKSGNGLNVLREEAGSGSNEGAKIMILSDKSLERIEPDASIVVGGVTSGAKLTFFNGQTYSRFWVEETIDRIFVGDYAGTEPVMAITAVTAITNKNVANGTLIANAGRPTHVEVTINSGVKVFLAVTWNGGTPAYNGSSAGNYDFEGTITLPTGITNPSTLKAAVRVVVAA